MSHNVGLLAAALFAFATALYFAIRTVRYAHLRWIGEERTRGNIPVRRRMTNLTGRQKDVYAGVMRAETMYGWVWIVWVRRARQPFYEKVGWAPFRWVARRQLARFADEHALPLD